MVNLVGVYMMPAQNLIIYGNDSYRYENHPGHCTGTKLSFQYKSLF